MSDYRLPRYYKDFKNSLLFFFFSTITAHHPLSPQMSDPLPYKNDIPMKAKTTTKKAAVVKRKTATQKSYTVAELRALLQQAAGALIAIDHWLDAKIEQMTKEQR